MKKDPDSCNVCNDSSGCYKCDVAFNKYAEEVKRGLNES